MYTAIIFHRDAVRPTLRAVQYTFLLQEKKIEQTWNILRVFMVENGCASLSISF